MTEYIGKADALNVNFRISVNIFESRRKAAERAVQAYADAISKLPAADVRPVARGKWKVFAHKTYYDVSCSVCGINSFFQVDGKDSVSYANFCPNCGADMRRKADGT